MPEVRVETVAARSLAAAKAVSSRADLGRDIIRLLDMVWPVLRQQSVRTGHNVVIYRPPGLSIEAGVEAFGDFAETDSVHRSSTPAGRVATTAHWGDYSAMEPAYAALERWCADNGGRTSQTNWEVYGDWDDDPARRRVDIFFLLDAEPT